MKLGYITGKQVSIFYKAIEPKKNIKMHIDWNKNKLGIEHCENWESLL